MSPDEDTPVDPKDGAEQPAEAKAAKKPAGKKSRQTGQSQS
jgi:hypothetical protein